MPRYQYEFAIKQDNQVTFIAPGWSADHWCHFFLDSNCFTDEDMQKLGEFINLVDHLYITSKIDVTLQFLEELGEKFTKHFNIFIDPNLLKLSIKKEAYLFISERRSDDGVIRYHFRQKTIEGYQLYKMMNVKPVEKHTDVVVEKNVASIILEQENSQLKVLQKEMSEKAEPLFNLLHKVEENNKRILELQQHIARLNKQLINASPTEKNSIYNENKKLVDELNQLNEENETIEFNSDNKKKTLDKTELKVIVDHYKDSIRKINKQVENSDTYFSTEYRTDHSFVGKLPKLYFSSQYVEDFTFSISNIIQKKSISNYQSFYAVIFNLLNKGKKVKASKRISLLSNQDQVRVYQFQMLILSLLKNGYLDDQVWRFFVHEESRDLFINAYQDLLYWVKQLCLLSMTPFTDPIVSIDDLNGYEITFQQDDYEINRFSISNSFDRQKQAEIWIADFIVYRINSKNAQHENILLELLEWIFNFQTFKEGQAGIIANFLNGKNTLGILPTGGGKSLTYYFSVLLQPKISLVIAPINSLIIDQIDKIKDLFGIDRFANITSSNKTMQADLEKFKKGEVLFTFASPERAQNLKFRNILIQLNHHQTIGSIILDEVHCLSEWGHDFRVPYLMLSETLNNYCKGTRYLGLTATASINVVRDLMVELSIREKDVITSEHMRRDNLEFEIKAYPSVYDAQTELRNTIFTNYGKGTNLDISTQNKEINSILVFSQMKSTMDSSVEVLHTMMDNHMRQNYPYQYRDEIGMYTGDFKDNQKDFMSNKKTMLIATKAFGMGIDKSNIRMTVHFGMPPSREAFYQEAGRAGRDGQKSLCKLFSIAPIDKYIEQSVKKFLNPNTSIDDMNNIKRILSRAGVDIATTFHFFLDSYDTPQTETEKALQLYEILDQHQQYTLALRQYDKKQTEKNLYILFKLGIIKNWSVIYTSFSDTIKTVDFEVEIHRKYKDIDYIKEYALIYVKAYQSDDISKLTESELYYNKQIESITSLEQLKDLLLAIRRWYHSIFITTKREQIANMYQMVQQFANKGPSIEIQEVIDRFFNITDSIGKTSEGVDLLTFDGSSLSEVVDFAFAGNDDDLIQRKSDMEAIMQSNVNAKNSLYTSLIHLRLNEFINNRNGDQRLDHAFSLLNEQETQEVIDSVIKNYHHLKDNHKVILINQLKQVDDRLIHKIYEQYEDDLTIMEYAVAILNSTFDESWY